jgi:hypothetical protein
LQQADRNGKVQEPLRVLRERGVRHTVNYTIRGAMRNALSDGTAIRLLH